MSNVLFVSALILFQGQQAPPVKTFTEPYLGIQFKYPSSWKIVKQIDPETETETGKHSTSKSPGKPNRHKLKVDKTRTIFAIPVAGTTDTAELQVVRTEFHASIDSWESIIKDESDLSHTQVIRLWQQDVLGVPMLFSRVDNPNKTIPTAAILGLFYTRTQNKLLLRLTCPASDVDNVTYEFDKMLETLRQTDGKLPQEDDPSIDLGPTTKKPEFAAVIPHIISSEPTGPKKPVKAPVTAEFVVANHKLVLHVPEGWTVSNPKETSLDLSNPGISSPLHFQFFSTLDSDAPATAVLKLTSKQLDDYTKVASREDTPEKMNMAGCTVSAVWRVGQNASGDLITGDLVGALGDYYFIATYRQSSLLAYKTERKVIEMLLKQVGIETGP